MAVYQTYTSMMNEKIRNSVSNPFQFEHIQDLTSIDNFVDAGPSVVMASPGMLQVCIAMSDAIVIFLLTLEWTLTPIIRTLVTFKEKWGHDSRLLC
jgi:hypothetical protein